MSDQSITQLPSADADQPNPNHENLVRDVQTFVSLPMTVAGMAMDKLNYGVGALTDGISRALPCFPAARLFCDMVFGWPHMHEHPPNLEPPVPPIFLPSIGPVILAGAWNVLINGLPAARCGDVGFGVWCGGFFPLFEVFTGSSNVFIGGSRASRMLIDFTRHCLPQLFSGEEGVEDAEKGLKGLSKVDKLMMFGVPAGMGALGIGSSLTDMANDDSDAGKAQSAALAEAYSAAAEAEAIDAAVTAVQTAANLAAMALSVGMGKDPGMPPFLCLGNFITGSFNVLIGGLPLPDWSVVTAGLKKLLKPWAEKKQKNLPAGSWRSKALCWITGHPVDIASGRVFTSQTDFELPGRIPIVFTRNYDSSAIDYEGPLGRGWTHPYDIHLWEDESQEMVILRTEEGMLVGFDLIEVGEKDFNPLEKQWLERLEEKVYVVRGKDGVRYKFTPIKKQDAGREIVEDFALKGKSESAALWLSEIEDRNGNRIRLFYEQGRLAWLEDDARTRMNFSYITLDNGLVRLAAVNQALDKDSTRTAKLVNFTYDSEGRLTNATDRGLVPWRYSYDKYLLIRETNRNGLSFHFEYRGEGRGARCVHTWGDGGIYERWIDYDRDSRMTVVENSLRAKTAYYFNELYLPVRIVDALGGEQHFHYGSNGELLSETDQIGRVTKYLYNEQFECISITNPDGTVRRFEYTSEGLPVKLIDEAGAIFRREYNARGNITTTIDALGHRQVFSYNQHGDLEKAINPIGGITKYRWNEHGQIIELVTPAGATTRFIYDDRGRLMKAIDSLGYTRDYAYDDMARLVRVVRPDGTRRHYAYDPEGNLTNFLDANGTETRFRYVDYNKLGERIDGLGNTLHFYYNTEAKLVEVRNERDEVYRFAYDALNRMKQEIGFDALKWEYDYDSANQLIARTDPARRVTRFVRDLLGRVIERRRPDGTSISFGYDSVGRMIAANTPNSKIEFNYNELGQTISEYQNGGKIEHEYDKIGRRIRRRSPTGQIVEFTYDADSQLRCLLTPLGSIEFEYDKAGRVAKQYMPGDMEESFYYDNCGRIIEQTLQRPKQTLFFRRYKYDAEGNLTELSDSKKGITRFAYDPSERLREVIRPDNKVEQFIYDSSGNLLRRGEKEFRYNQPDRLTKNDDALLIYDEVGNLIEKRHAGSVIYYSYDSDNQLIAVESKGGRVEFEYDAFGRRITKKTNDGETGFLWDGDVLLSEQQREVINEYVFDYRSYAPLCRFDERNFEVYHNDHLGTPRELTDIDGQLVWSASYDVYGGVIQVEENDRHSQIRFQGQYQDNETGLFYNRFRYYDSDTSRYLSQDPIRLAGGTNLYRYTSNPVKLVDPLGLQGGSGTAPGTVNRPINSPFYSVVYEAQLTEGVDYPGHSDRYHFSQGNRQLDEAMKSDPDFARALEGMYPGITQGVAPGPRGGYPRQAPHEDLTWHHHPTREGVLQLIPTAHHSSPGAVQTSLHPDQKGGMENWGGGRRKNRSSTDEGNC